MENKNNIILLGYYGGDKTHALSAWCSTFKEIGIDIPEEVSHRIDTIFEYVSKTKKRSASELLDRLASALHHSPFEKSMLHFLITTDIASHIHLLKHRISVSINSESARYKELIEDKFYIPVDWPDDEQGMLTKHVITSYKKYHECIARLVAKGYSRKRAKESARFYLPYCIQYTADVSFNFRSFIHFQNLRNKPDAQLEIQEIAQAMLEQVKSLPGNPFHESLKAFDLY